MRFPVLFLAVAVLSACSGTSFAPTTPGGATAQNQLFSLYAKNASPANITQGHSWMDARAKNKKLLYLTDFLGNAVDVYTYPDAQLVGKLTGGLNGPAGECTNAKGDVFVANLEDASIVEYAHGGTFPIATLNDVGYDPNGCAVDPTTGNLAVTNYSTASGTGSGNVAIYTNAQGHPNYYSNASFSSYAFCSYDKNGNLFVDGGGGGTADTFEFAELAKASPALRTIALNQQFSQVPIAGGVQALSNTVAVGDPQTGIIYQFAINGSTGTKLLSTTLQRAHFFYQYTIRDRNVVGPVYDRKGGRAQFWSFPAGGKPTTKISGIEDPVGTAISR